jgi:hypothetical protein
MTTPYSHIPLGVIGARALESFEDSVRRKRPVRVLGVASEWPALARWTPEHFRSAYGEAWMDGFRVRDGAVEFDAGTGLVTARSRCSDFMDELVAPRIARRRVRDTSFLRRVGVAGDAPTPAQVRGRLKLTEVLWMSAKGTRSALHFDQTENLLVQVRGTKRLRLFPPDQSRFLYPHPPWSSLPQFSRVDLARPDLRRFPRLSRASGFVTNIGPGDAVYIPSGYWHDVESEELTISLGFRWWRPSAAPLLVLAELYKRVRGLAR